MDNAIEYAGSNIQININCFREDENFYYFSFADTGIGVSPEHLNRLFERFYRVDKGPRPKTPQPPRPASPGTPCRGSWESCLRRAEE